MAIKTVNADNLAEFVKSHPQHLQSQEAVIEAVTPKADGPKTGVVGEGEETVNDAPKPQKAERSEEKPKKPDNKVQERFDELTRLRKEAEEAWESEYEARLKLEGEIAALRQTREEKPKEEAKSESNELPDPAKYTDQAAYLKDYADAVEKRTVAKLKAEQRQAEQERLAKEADAAMVAKIGRAKADLEDFEDVIDKADKRTRQDIPNHIKAAIYESEWGAHIAYELAKDPKEEARIFGLTPAKALLELGKIEQRYAASKPEKAEAPKPPETPKPPEPIAKLGEGSGVVVTDLSQPMNFQDYRQARLAQIRAKRRH